MKFFIFTVISLIVMGCSTHLTRTSYSINAGMSKQSVIDKMGFPDSRSMKGSDEALQYSEIVGFGQCAYIVVWLSEGQVTAVTNRSGPSVAGCGLGSKIVCPDLNPKIPQNTIPQKD